jgi:hypothetical protein
MNARERGQGTPNNLEPTRRRNTQSKEQPKPQQDSAEGNPLFSPVEHEQKLEVTEREKQLLQVMARVIAFGYIPSIIGEPRKKEAIEETLLNYIDKVTSTPSSTKNHIAE